MLMGCLGLFILVVISIAIGEWTESQNIGAIFFWSVIVLGWIARKFQKSEKKANKDTADSLLMTPVIQNTDAVYSMEEKPKKSTRTISFTYQNAQGEISSREVRVDSVDGKYLEGFCYSALETRTFRLDRIIGLIEQSGHYYDVEDWLIKQNIYPVKFEERSKPAPLLEISFTGFKKDRRAYLEELAEENNFLVRTTITMNLDYLVTGYNASDKKIDKAISVGAIILTEEEFENMIDTGEIPE